MKIRFFANIEKDTNHLLGWYRDDINYTTTNGEKEYKATDLIEESDLLLLKTDLSETKDMNQFISTLVKLVNTSLEATDFIYFSLKEIVSGTISHTEDGEIVLDEMRLIINYSEKTLTHPEGCIEVTEEVYINALDINANHYENGIFTNRDFRPITDIFKEYKEKTILLLNLKSGELIRSGFYSEVINLDKFFFQCNGTDQTNLKTALLVSSSTSEEQSIKVSRDDGKTYSWAVFTYDQLISIVSDMNKHITKILKEVSTLKTSVNGATTVEQIKLVVKDYLQLEE